MTDKINWGPAIPTPNGRPSWLPETERVVDLETAAGWRCSERGATAAPSQWLWDVITHIRLPADHPYYIVQRYNQEHGTDLVYWPGGDNPPEDWDGLGRLYVNSSFCDDDWPKHNSMRWNREGTCGDIIGYRRAAAPVEETDTVTLPRMTEREAQHWVENNTYIEWHKYILHAFKQLGLIKPEPTRLERFLASTDEPTIEAALEFERDRLG